MNTSQPIDGQPIVPVPFRAADGEALGPAYRTWRRLQHGQEQIVRFNRFLPRYDGRMRHQNGHEHRCSVCFLFTQTMIEIRPFVVLDELLLTRCVEHHDEPEGILGLDLPANMKQSSDDLKEYLIFEELYKPLGFEVWEELQRSFLLQFCLENPACFPEDARGVMDWLATNHCNEALFFQGVQMYDYLFYAFECFAEHGAAEIMDEVSANQVPRLDRIANLLPGFREVVWTPERRLLFQQTHMDLVI